MTVAEQAIDDLRPVTALVAAIAEPGQFATAPLQIRRADVVEHHGAVTQVFLGQALLDALLLIPKPIQRRIDLPGPDRRRILPSQSQHEAQRGVRRLQRQSPQGRKLGARRDDPGNDHRQGQILEPALTRIRLAAGEPPLQPHVPQRPQHRRDIAVRQGAPDLQGLAAIAKGHAAFQKRAQPLHHGHRQLGEIGQGAFLDLAALAPALAQQHGGRRGAIGYDLDEHSDRESKSIHRVKN